jgi:hypothetical protein
MTVSSSLITFSAMTIIPRFRPSREEEQGAGCKARPDAWNRSAVVFLCRCTSPQKPTALTQAYSWQDCNSCKTLRTSIREDLAFNDVGPSRLFSHLNDGLARHIVLNPQQVHVAKRSCRIYRHLRNVVEIERHASGLIQNSLGRRHPTGLAILGASLCRLSNFSSFQRMKFLTVRTISAGLMAHLNARSVVPRFH